MEHNILWSSEESIRLNKKNSGQYCKTSVSDM